MLIRIAGETLSSQSRENIYSIIMASTPKAVPKYRSAASGVLGAMKDNEECQLVSVATETIGLRTSALNLQRPKPFTMRETLRD